MQLHRSNRPPLGRARQYRIQRLLRLTQGQLLAALATVLIGSFLVTFYVILPQLNPDGRDGSESNGLPTKAFCKRSTPPLACAHGGDPMSAHANSLKAFASAIR